MRSYYVILSAACFLSTGWWKFFQLRISSSIVVAMGKIFLSVLCCYGECWGQVIYQSTMLAHAPDCGGDAQEWECRVFWLLMVIAGDILITCRSCSPRDLYGPCPWFILFLYIVVCLTNCKKLFMIWFINKFSNCINWLLTFSNLFP